MKKDNKPKKIIIVGGGISGLTSGIFAQKYGFISEIYEKNPVAGGLCACWKRKGQYIDGCIHWLTGTKHGSSLRALWDEVGAFNDDQIIKTDNFASIEYGGKTVTFWSDLERLEKEMIEISPIDSKRIRRLMRYIRMFQNMPLPVELPLSLMNLRDFIGIAFGMIKYLIPYLVCMNTLTSKFANKFKSPILKHAILNLVPGDVNLYATAYAFGTVASGNGGVLKGGSSTLVENLVDSYENKGGKINYCSEIKQIIIKDGKAIGIELKNGEKKYADYIISASDPFNTLSLVPVNYSIPLYTRHLNDAIGYPIPSAILLTYAVDKTELAKLNLGTTFEFFTRPYKVGDKYKDSIRIRDYSYDDCFINGNKVTVQVMISQFDSDYSYWNSFKNKEDYNNAKNALGENVKTEIIRKFPTLEGKIELIDVCTHKTFERYAKTYHGSFQPFELTAKGKMLNHNGKIGNIKNLFLASQWSVTPGGIPVAMLAGKFTIQRILRKEFMNYRITKKLKFKFY